ncbi:MAG: putative flavoprotein YhiN, partial [Flavobacteriales bacterium]
TIKQLLAKVKPNDSWQSCLKKWKLHPIQKDLLVDIFGKKFISQDELAEKIKKIPITIVGHESFDQAISTQGGVKKTNLNQDLSFKKHPKWFAAGEMLDQDGPTGGYLIQHAISSGFVAAKGIISQQKGT